ncbi:MAG: 16S rRNA (guanine(966)-N(2))-methyltransferase RsmD [Ahrensia sp.]|nr:16S rRNA (guanine(966)-N(2))-methyltransferase RsmD [Ahrensia sp.]
MRIVGGRLRGRRLATPTSQAIRPTTDRIRESLFNILESAHRDRLTGARVLDVFAGTGALGIEAISRGAQFALFMDSAVQARALLRRNIDDLRLGGTIQIHKRDALRPGRCHPREPFDLVFADPPYGKGLGEQALAALRRGGWFANETLIVLEEEKGALPSTLDGLRQMDRRDFGSTSIGFFENAAA